jgi:hypothetical protein
MLGDHPVRANNGHRVADSRLQQCGGRRWPLETPDLTSTILRRWQRPILFGFGSSLWRACRSKATDGQSELGAIICSCKAVWTSQSGL